MQTYYLYEDKRLPKLPIWVSSNISNKIGYVKYYNRDNIDGINRLIEEFEILVDYISNPVIAFDNAGRYIHYPNGATHMVELGFDASYIIKNNNKNNCAYVYIFDIKIDLTKFGLKTPPPLTESANNVYHINESRLRQIIQESIQNVLNMA